MGKSGKRKAEMEPSGENKNYDTNPFESSPLRKNRVLTLESRIEHLHPNRKLELRFSVEPLAKLVGQGLRLFLSEKAADLRRLARLPRWAKPVALLTTMPGIGLITALTILAELGNLKRFSSRAAVANYAGLIPILRDSNDKHFSGGISRRGPKHLRAMLVEAAWMSVPRVPAYHDLFTRVQFRKGKPAAIVAVARRMLEDAFTMLKKDEAFRYTAVSITEARKNELLCASTATRRGRKAASSVAG
jgi:hypothetical protein